MSGKCIAGDSTDYSTEEITVFGSSYTGTSEEMPGFVQVMDRKGILSVNGTSLSDVLRHFNSVQVRSYGAGPSLGTVSVNGSGAEHTLIMLNGQKLNSAQNNMFDAALLSKSAISRIEVLSGGLSAVFGSEAVGGVVNIITQMPETGGLSAKINASLGSYGNRSFNVDAGTAFRNASVFLSVSSEESDNEYPYYFYNGSLSEQRYRQNSAYARNNAAFGAEYRAGSDILFSYTGNYLNADRGLPGPETGSLPSNANQQDNSWLHTFKTVINTGQRLAISGELDYMSSDSRYYDGFSAGSFYLNSSFSGKAEAGYTGKDFHLTAGFEGGIYRLESNEISSEAVRDQFAIFAGGEVQIGERLSIFPSARVDNIDGGVVTGNLGINLILLDEAGLRLKARAGNNFAAPSFNDLYWKNAGNPELMPEKSFSFSAGLVSAPRSLNGISFEASYSDVNTGNKIVWTPALTGFWKPENLRRVRTQSLNATAGVSLSSGASFSVNAKAGASYTSSRKTEEDFPGDQNSGKQLPYVPYWSFKSGADAVTGNLSAGLFLEYLGERPANTGTLQDAFILEANAGYRHQAGPVSISGRLEVNNILNEDYSFIAGYPMPLRNYTFNVNIEY